LYGNNTEYYQNLGTLSSLTAPGASMSWDLSGIMGSVGGMNTVEYTVVGITGSFTTGATDIFAGSNVEATNTSASGWTQTRRNQIVPQSYFNALNSWKGQVTTTPGQTQLLAASDPASFTNSFGTADRLAASFPLRMSADVDQLLHLIGRPFAGTGLALTDLGSAMLTAGGMFTLGNPGPQVIPIPAAAVLFATGVVGLIGVARRRTTPASC
jgi:hypothetical protein